MYITRRHICFYAYMPKKTVSFIIYGGTLVRIDVYLERNRQIRIPFEAR